MEPLMVALLWHQHQPNYKQADQNVFILPWVRLHALKDYYDLVAILDKFPKVHQTFNLVPSLLTQLDDYVTDSSQDHVQILTKMKAEELDESDRIDVLKYFFQANRKNLIDVYPGYRSLLQKRGEHFDEKNPQKALKRFDRQDYLDLQVWYNLCWVGEAHKQESPFRELFEKDHFFSEEDKHNLLTAQKDIIKKIIPKYREVEQRGQIELSTTPFYHPILPLLCDSGIARISQPAIQLPGQRFVFPEDADEQIRRAIQFHEEHFGQKPMGMWPSEGSVSEEVAALFVKHQVKWIATDEEILLNSWNAMNIRNQTTREDLYSPWLFESNHGEINIFFRDHTLSDLIGFVYQNWDAEKAADDFIHHLKDIRSMIVRKNKSGLAHSVVSVILDGENCWEYYSKNGIDFLEAFYHQLSSAEELQSVTFREVLKQNQPVPKLTKLFPGSWINHNFAIWIGHPEDNRAWELLFHARKALVQAEKANSVSAEKIKQAWEENYIAEGSDWCWWYGDEHETQNAVEFDHLFRSHLIRIYQLVETEVPVELYEPIRRAGQKKLVITEPIGFVSPVIDGLETNYFEWKAGGTFYTRNQGAAMHRMSNFVESMNYGFDLQNFYLKIVYQDGVAEEELRRHDIAVDILAPSALIMRLSMASLLDQSISDHLAVEINGKKEILQNGVKVAYQRFLEIAIPFVLIHSKEGEAVRFQIKVFRENQLIESLPRNGVISFKVPNPDFERIEWIV